MREIKKQSALKPESTFHNFFNNTLEGIFQTSPEGKLLVANPALARIFGYASPREMVKIVNESVKQVYVDKKRRSTLLRVMRKKGTIANFESQVYRKDGSILWVKENVWSVKDKGGKTLFFEGTVHDISLRKKAEEEREKLIHEQVAREEVERTKEKISKLYRTAREGIKARDEFLDIASHELRTPLTSLQLQIQLLRRKKLPDNLSQVKEKLETCEMQVKRLGKLINNLLDVSRINSNKLVLDKERTNLPEIVKEVVIRFDNAAKIVGSQLEFINGKRVVGTWDKSKIDQVATNLIANAIKYGEGKPILVKVDRDREVALLSVKDNGIGITKDDSKRVFDRFTRSDLAKKYGGLGLGLYITQQIVIAHGGNISVKSEPNKGSEFTVRLPTD